MRNFLWFIVGLLVAAGSVLAQNMTLTETLLTNINTNVQAGSAATGGAVPASALYMAANSGGVTGGVFTGVISCNNHTFNHITSATTTASTNANCSSTLTQITGVATEAANTGETWGTAFWGGLKNTSANGLCINSVGTGGVDVDIWYAQF